MAPVNTEDVFTSQVEDGALADLCTRFKVPKPEVLVRFLYQVNEAKLHEEIFHGLDTRDLEGVNINVKVTNYNGVKTTEAVKGLLEVWEAIGRPQRISPCIPSSSVSTIPN